MSEELKKCPFCGADPDISVQDYDIEDPYYVVACTNCNMSHSSSDDEDVAIRNWNDHPIEDAQAARIAELEAAIRRCCRNCWANDATDAAQCRLCGLKEALEGAGE